MAVAFSLPSSHPDPDPDDDDEPPNTPRPPVRGLPKEGSLSQRIKGFTRYYDADGNGELDSEECAAALRDLALAQDGEKEMTDRAIFMALKNTRLNVYLIMALGGMVILSLVYGNKGFRDVNGSIERSAVTEVNVDGSGVAHLTDKSGREMSTRGTGDLFSAERVEVGPHDHSRVLYCIPVEAAAGMVDSLNQGATARLALLGHDGSLEEKIVSLGNSFEDSGSTLKFGDGCLDVQVLFDDDSCNVNLSDEDEDEDGEEGGGEEESKEGQGFSGGPTRGRGLATAAVLARNREIYRRAREEIRTGEGRQQRILNEDSGTLVPVIANPGAGGCGSSNRANYIVALTEEHGPDTARRPADRCATLASLNGGILKETFSSAMEGCLIELHPEAVQALQLNPNVRYVEASLEMSILGPAQGPPGHRARGRARAMQEIVPWNLDRIDQCSNTLDFQAYTKADASGVRLYFLGTGIKSDHTEFSSATFPADCQRDFTSAGNALVDGNGHGTHVAGIACGDTYGVAKNCEICSVKVISPSGSGSLVTFVGGIEHAIDDCEGAGATCVINISLQVYWMSILLNEAVANAVDKGIVVVVQAGNFDNGACGMSPMSEPKAITVGASDMNDSRWIGDGGYYGSNYGTCVDFYAPGFDIKSAWNDEGTHTVSGTSYSTPHVAGIAAGLLAAGINSSDVRGRIREDAKFIGSDNLGSDMWLANSAGGCQPTSPPAFPPTMDPTVATSEATSEVTSVATSEVTSVATTEVTSVATTEVTSEATSEATTEVTSLITVRITTDDYPEDIMWYIYDTTNSNIIFEELYLEDANTNYLSEGSGPTNSRYWFSINYYGSDEFRGSYSVLVNDVEVVVGGSVQSYVDVFFDGTGNVESW